jgi:hypothetical protein
MYEITALVCKNTWTPVANSVPGVTVKVAKT